jgi:hypothetical protein
MVPDCEPSGKIESYGTLNDMDCEICLYMSSARLQPIVFSNSTANSSQDSGVHG